MKQISVLILMILVLVLPTGCFQPFGKPVSDPAYKKWKKAGVSELEVKKALLECGYAEPYVGGNYGLHPSEVTPYHLVMRFRCMEKSGFRNSAWNACDKKNDDTACLLPESRVPDRSVERRLNGPYCKARPSLSTQEARDLCIR